MPDRRLYGWGPGNVSIAALETRMRGEIVAILDSKGRIETASYEACGFGASTWAKLAVNDDLVACANENVVLIWHWRQRDYWTSVKVLAARVSWVDGCRRFREDRAVRAAAARRSSR